MCTYSTTLRLYVGLVLVLCSGSAGLFAEEKPQPAADTLKIPTAAENPYRLARVGDWVEWKIATQTPSTQPNVPPEKSESHIKETARTVGPKLLTVQLQIMGQAEPVFMDTQYPLDRPFQPEWMGRVGRVEVLKSEMQQHEVGGHTLECVVKEMQMTNTEGVTKLTVWYQPEIPMGGIARMELHAVDGSVTIREAQAYGREAVK